MKNNTKKFYALLGLSEPIITDYVTGQNVSFKLNQSEEDLILKDVDGETMEFLIEEAKYFFKKNDFVFYKNSRWTNSDILHSLNPDKVLSRWQESIRRLEAV